MVFDPANSKAGDHVDLRFEMDTLVLLHTCPHPLDPAPEYPRRPIAYQLSEADPVAADDYCRTFRPENGRGFENNAHLSPRQSVMCDVAPTMTKPSTLKPATATYRRVVPAGEYWIHRVERGQVLRIVDVEGNQAADTLFFNAADPAERYSAVDTIREQRNVYLGVGSKLRSTANRVMLEIVADTVGRHDTLGGACATESNTVRYALDKKTMHACRDSWLLAVAEHPDFGLTKRDITHNINFFMNVPVTPDGGLTFADGVSGPGQYVELRAEMDVIALISNCPQLNNPCNAYNPTPVEVLIFGMIDQHGGQRGHRGRRRKNLVLAAVPLCGEGLFGCSIASSSPTAGRSPAGSSARCAGSGSRRSRLIRRRCARAARRMADAAAAGGRRVDVRRVRVGLRVDRDRRDAEPPQRADDPAGDLAAVGDEHAVEHEEGLGVRGLRG